jgi:putative pyruvate formate lyase activating enzyme
MWEEPVISGTRGSGTIFFSGCSLKCIYCQNHEISGGRVGKEMSSSELARVMLSLEREGAHNINLVTPTHFVPSIIGALDEAREAGLSLPIVYNTGSYESESAIDALSGKIDIWLPDLKYYKAYTARRYSYAPDLPTVARRNIERMVELSPSPILGEDGLLKKGVVVRILLLPGHVAEAKLNLKYLYNTFGDSVYVSLMCQYTPREGLPSPLHRTVTRDEYRELLDYAATLGITKAFTQDLSSASDSFIPDFSLQEIISQ